MARITRFAERFERAEVSTLAQLTKVAFITSARLFVVVDGSLVDARTVTPPRQRPRLAEPAKPTAPPLPRSKAEARGTSSPPRRQRLCRLTVTVTRRATPREPQGADEIVVAVVVAHWYPTILLLRGVWHSR